VVVGAREWTSDNLATQVAESSREFRRLRREQQSLLPLLFYVVTPTMRSWNQFSAFIEEWDELRMAAR